MSLQDLDQLLGLRHDDPALAEQLAQPLPLEELITLAQSRGLTITEDDVFQAQQREQTKASAADLQQQMAPSPDGSGTSFQVDLGAQRLGSLTIQDRAVQSR